MKKHLFLIILTLITCFAGNLYAGTIDLLSSGYYSTTASWSSSYNPETKTITFSGGWGGHVWWVDDYDCSDWISITLTYETPSSGRGGIKCEYKEGSPSDSWVSINENGSNLTSATLTFAATNIKRVFVQLENAGNLVLTSAYVTTADPAEPFHQMIATGTGANASGSGISNSSDGSTFTFTSVSDPIGNFDHNVLQVSYDMKNISDNDASYKGRYLVRDDSNTTNTDATGYAFWYMTENSTDQIYMEIKEKDNSGYTFKLAATDGCWKYVYRAADHAHNGTSYEYEMWVNGKKDNFASGSNTGKFYFTEFQVTNVTSDDDVCSSCTAPNHVVISGNWDYFGGETISLTATAYDDGDNEINEEDIIGYQWKHNGSDIDGATSKTFTKTNCTSADGGDYSCVVSTGATCSTESSPMGTKVYVLQCYTGGETSYNFTRTGSSQAGTTTVTLSASTQYEFKIYAGSTASTDYHMGNNGTIDEDATNWDFEGGKNNVKLNSGLGGTFTFAIDYSANGGAPKVSVTYPRKRIYLNTGGNDLWSKDNVTKFGVYYFRQDASSGWSDLMDVYPCGSNIYYTEIPQWNGVKMDVVRLQDAATNANKSDWWNSYKFNQTNDCPVSANDYITITGWNENNYTYETFSVPTFTVTYNANGDGAGNATGTTGSVPTDSNSPYDCGSDVTILGNTGSLAKEGHDFDGWNTAADGSGDPYIAGGTLSSITANTILYAQWEKKSYTLTWDLAGGTVATAGTAADKDATGSPSDDVEYGTSLTAPEVTKTGYNFSAWSPAVASTMPASDTEYTATWTIKTTTITIDANTSYHGSSTPGTVTATWGQALPAFTAAEGESGYGLVGYYTGANDGIKIINADGKLVRNTTYATDEDTPKWKYEGATETFYPHYDPLYTVTVNDDGNGSGETDKATYFAGETVTITATPNSGYNFANWTTSDGVSFASSTTSPTTFTMPSKAVTVTANFELNLCTDSKTIQCETDRIIPTTGTSAPSKLEIITSSHHYSDYHGDGYCDFKGSEEGELYYLFRAPSSTYNFTVYLTNVDHAYMNIYTTNSAEKCDATTITYGGTTYYKKSYHALDGPTGDNPIGYRTVSSVSLNGTYIIGLYGKSWTVYDQVVIEASSDVFCQYTVSATATNGSVTGTGTYYAGETVSLTPSADPGYEFTAWSSLSGVTVSGYEDDNPLTFTMPDNAVSVTASFETSCTPHDITLTNDGNGSATASPSSACEDEAVEITATPNTGYHFDYWTTSDVSITGHESDNPLTVTMPEGDIEVTAHFLKSMIAYGESGNIGSNTGDFQYGDGSSLSASSVTDPGSKFSHNVLKYTYNINSSSGYHGITLPYDAGYTTASATGATGIGFWYRTESTTDDVLMYFKMYYSGSWNQTMVFLPATNQKWTYYYLANSNVTSATGFGFYINGSGDSKATGVIGSDGHFWLAEMEPITVSDATVNANESKTIAHVVRNLTIYQGGEVTNSEDVIVTGSIAYHRPATTLDQWFTFAVPFTLSEIEVYDEYDTKWYDVNAVYYTTNNADQSDNNPTGLGHFYLKYLKNDGVNQMTNDRWMYIDPAHSDQITSDNGTRSGYPKKNQAYIILFDSKKPVSMAGYWAANPNVRFVGVGSQTIDGTFDEPEVYEEDDKGYGLYANNTLHSVTLTNDAYIMSEDGTRFDLEDKPIIKPFECYIQATAAFKKKVASIPMRRQGGDTPTAIEDIELNDTSRTIKVLHQGHLIIIRNGHSYDFMGARVR